MPTTDEQFWNAIKNGDLEVATKLLEKDRSLAGKNFEPEILHTDGFPLYQAAYVNFLREYGAKK